MGDCNMCIIKETITQPNLKKMNKRPKIKLKLTTIDKILEIPGWTSILAIWILTITNYTNLPETIPMHYNGAGQADGFGGKGNILTLPIIATILFVGLTILKQFPYVFNYPTNITSDNALRQYANATRLIRYLKLILVIIFGLIAFKTIQMQTDKQMDLGFGFYQ